MPGLAAWELPEELKLLRATVADFVRKEILPEEAKLDSEAYKLPPEVLERVQGIARDAACGVWSHRRSTAGRAEPARPVRRRGGGRAVPDGRVCPGRRGVWLGSAERDLPGAEDKIQKYAVPTIERGEKTFVAIFEPSGGADPGRAIKTTAKRDGDEYIVNGSKTWITGADASRWGVVFAAPAARAAKG